VNLVSGVFTAVGAALLAAYLDPGTPEASTYGFTTLIAVGMGLTLHCGQPQSSVRG